MRSNQRIRGGLRNLMILGVLGLALATGSVLTGCGDTPVTPFAQEGDGVFSGPSRDAGLLAAGNAVGKTGTKTFTVNESGGTFTYGHMTVRVPKGAVAGVHTLTISDPVPGQPVWTLDMDPNKPFALPVEVSVQYASFDQWEVHYLIGYDARTGSWFDLGAVDDLKRKVITATIDRPISFGLTDELPDPDDHGFRGDGTAGWW